MGITITIYKGIGGSQKKETIKYPSAEYFEYLDKGYKVYADSKDAVSDWDDDNGRPKERDYTSGSNTSSSSAPTATISDEHQTALDNAQSVGESLGWSSKQIQWSIDAVNAQYTDSNPPSDTNSPTNTGGMTIEDLSTGLADGTITSQDDIDSFGGSSNSPVIDTGDSGAVGYDGSSEAFDSLSADDQAVISSIFEVMAGNDQTMADKLIKAFEAASAVNDPYFAEQLKIAIDAIESGYVSIENEASFMEEQIKNRLSDIEQSYQSQSDFMSLELASTMRGIQQGYEQNLDTLQTGLAASGFTQSSRRSKKEGILDEATGELRESTNRNFEYQQGQADDLLDQEQRDAQLELERLAELTAEKELDFLHDAEVAVGTDNLPNLGSTTPIGGITGDLPTDNLNDNIDTALGFTF